MVNLKLAIVEEIFMQFKMIWENQVHVCVRMAITALLQEPRAHYALILILILEEMLMEDAFVIRCW